MVAAAAAALTVYDMCKGAEKGIVVGPIELLSKTGGKSGDWIRPRERPPCAPPGPLNRLLLADPERLRRGLEERRQDGRHGEEREAVPGPGDEPRDVDARERERREEERRRRPPHPGRAGGARAGRRAPARGGARRRGATGGRGGGRARRAPRGPGGACRDRTPRREVGEARDAVRGAVERPGEDAEAEPEATDDRGVAESPGGARRPRRDEEDGTPSCFVSAARARRIPAAAGVNGVGAGSRAGGAPPGRRRGGASRRSRCRPRSGSRGGA